MSQQKVILWLRYFLALAWLLLVSGFAHAQAIARAQGISSAYTENLFFAVGLSFVGGLAWTSHKEANAESPNKRLLLTITSDLLVSVVAGISIYFLTSAVTDSVMIQCACITISGYGGALVMEPATKAVIDFVKGIFNKGKTT